MSRGRKRYSPEKKLHAVGLFSQSVPVSQISGELSVPQDTVKSWVYGRRGTDEKGTPYQNRCDHETYEFKKALNQIKAIISNLVGLVDSSIQNLKQTSAELSLPDCHEAINLVAKLAFALERLSRIESNHMSPEEVEMPTRQEVLEIIKSDPFLKNGS